MVSGKGVDGHHRNDPVAAHDGDMAPQVGRTGEHLLGALAEQPFGERPPRTNRVVARLHLEAPHRGHDHRRVRVHAGHTAFDVEELLGADVAAEAGLRDQVVPAPNTNLVGDYRRAAMGDVPEGAGVHQRRSTFQGLQQIGVKSILEEHRHGTRPSQGLGGHRLQVTVITDHHPPQPGPQIREIGGQPQHRHHLRRCGDVEPGLARNPVGRGPQPHDDLA